ncbi:MAG: hypothetical protein IKI95_05875 [Clostridia bacterium]|nr:hypothetical protein [Clostridia bacterium]
MSKYTMELRQLFDSTYFTPQLYTRSDIEGWFKDYELTDYLTQEEIDVINTRGVWSKDKLAKKIVDHYYMREIGFETPALFKHYAKVNMQEIMERYLPLIYSASIEYDPLVNVDFKETFTRNIENTSTGESNSTSNSSSLNVNSDTPQGEINKNKILQGEYATSTGASEGEVSDNTNTSSNGNTEENYTKSVKGNSGVSATAQKMILQYRENIITIDRDIIKDLNILFMGLY